MQEQQNTTLEDRPLPQWRPLSSRQRRVAGVLVEKAKTTPDAYPMSLNALVTGSNQKSNRDPQMSLTAEEVEEVLEQLRGMGAVAEVHGSGRVARYRHLLYDWLGVDKHEIAVMAELLLRGEQTVGELRGRASRMEAIADLAALKPILDSLEQKRLLVSLTPEGRGQVVTHNLYPQKELEQLQARFRGGAAPAYGDSATGGTDGSAAAGGAAVRSDSTASGGRDIAGVSASVISELRAELTELRKELRELQEQMRALRG